MKAVKITTSATVIFLLCAALIIGCGDDYADFTHNAPDGSTIDFAPSAVDIVAGDGTVVQPLTITVRDSSGEPLNGIKVAITGGFAYPFVPSLYYFYESDNTTLRASGFTGVTNASGAYNFSIHIPVTATTATGVTFPNSFIENIEARSGTAFGSVEVSYNQ